MKVPMTAQPPRYVSLSTFGASSHGLVAIVLSLDFDVVMAADVG